MTPHTRDLYLCLGLALLVHLSVFVLYPAAPFLADKPRMQVLLQTKVNTHKMITSPEQAASPQTPARAPKNNRPAAQTISRSLPPSAAPEPIIELPPISDLGNAIDSVITPKLDLSIKPEESREKQKPPGLNPQPEAARSKMAKSLDKAVKPDCKNAYSAMGPLAAVPLLYDALTDTGCAW
ncbi:hypothetical protein [Janthinobacterium sp. B9-8]|uniref:hypothetical protein n=1 Tax=Janthinobacterium sp. B9-8 TaxID=1236179 RepID=UPI00061CDDD1|nr:hypothetical protein [Janthinobacterium sp. B9-8]AMC33861.1 hypothetical protein VN23_04225 [Janthinobacterium sp. B9-8]